MGTDVAEMQDKWHHAQENELEWWKWFITEELRIDSREQLLGYRQAECTFELMRMGFPWRASWFSGKNRPLYGKVLDVGCGPVSMLECARADSLVAVDPLLSEYYKAFPGLVELGYACSHGQGPVYYTPGTVKDIQDEDFDIVWCVNVLDHTADWKEELRQMHRVLKPGGVLYLSTDCRCMDHPGDKYHPSVFTAEMLLGYLDLTLDFAIERHTPIKQASHWRLGGVIAWK